MCLANTCIYIYIYIYIYNYTTATCKSVIKLLLSRLLALLHSAIRVCKADNCRIARHTSLCLKSSEVLLLENRGEVVSLRLLAGAGVLLGRDEEGGGVPFGMEAGGEGEPGVSSPLR